MIPEIHFPKYRPEAKRGKQNSPCTDRAPEEGQGADESRIHRSGRNVDGRGPRRGRSKTKTPGRPPETTQNEAACVCSRVGASKLGLSSKQEGEEKKEEEPEKKSRHVIAKLKARAAKQKLDPLIEDQFQSGRLLAAIASRPGQSGCCDGRARDGQMHIDSVQSRLHLAPSTCRTQEPLICHETLAEIPAWKAAPHEAAAHEAAPGEAAPGEAAPDNATHCEAAPSETALVEASLVAH